MFAKQLTVFIENRTGRLCEVLNVLKNNNVNILSLSLADTTEFGLLRLIVNDPALGKEKLSECGFSSLLSDVSIIKIPHKVGSLQELLRAIDNDGVNIEYMYGLSIEGESAYVVLKASDIAKVDAILIANNIETVSCEQIANG
ncbi:MAG: amino acid-binding protein [Ruminococcaceae bacterium]|nr:amino acid-binding protein [Oscillospiraceae bacterium]MBO4972158.1 amino acid-binding protein [Clostridia bacterium]MBQ1259759.1 amino acid-binding protein [Clostridia bacterium]